MTTFEIDMFVHQSDIEKSVLQMVLCPICRYIPEKPVSLQCITCQQTYCRPCILKWVVDNRTCPVCKNHAESEYILPDKIGANLLVKINIKCTNKCEWIGRLEELENHLKICEEALYNCPNHLCNIKIKNAKLDEHLLVCDYSEVNCTDCNIILPRHVLHDHKCVAEMKLCNLCKFYIKQDKWDTHNSKCSSRLIQCAYCPSTIKLSEREKHVCSKKYNIDCLIKIAKLNMFPIVALPVTKACSAVTLEAYNKSWKFNFQEKSLTKNNKLYLWLTIPSDIKMGSLLVISVSFSNTKVCAYRYINREKTPKIYFKSIKFGSESDLVKALNIDKNIYVNFLMLLDQPNK